MKRDMQHAEHDVIAEQGNKAENNSIRQELACYGGNHIPAGSFQPVVSCAEFNFATYGIDCNE